MTSFGIKEIDFSGNIRFFVGEDDVLWDWLHADNIELAGRYKARAVEAPEGYAFNYKRAMVAHFVGGRGDVLAELPHAGGMNDTSKQYLPATRSLVLSKALMLMNRSADVFGEDTSVLSVVSAEDFAALDIDESRVLSAHFRDV
jgi:hypothetical protein